MNRGSPTSATRPPRSGPRFNEAPIHESGKSGRLHAAAPSEMGGFNEAPIHESGKCDGSRTLRPHPLRLQ